MCGIGTKHIRRLCENQWEGGFGYDPNQVGNLTLDQVFLLLCDKKYLTSGGKDRVTEMPSLQATTISKGGVVKGRAADGTEIYGRIGGKSLARRLAEEQAKQASSKPPISERKKSRRRVAKKLTSEGE